MCGIVGYVGHRNAIPILLDGLGRLEYRGYDSSGIAGLNDNGENLFVVKEKGKLACLKEELYRHPVSANIGIGHTRWATHGEPSRDNAHPHLDAHKRVAIVHNGIIENYATLKEKLRQKGLRFVSQTDTEVAANLIGSYSHGTNLLTAVRRAVTELRGYFAFVAIAKNTPKTLVAFKRSNPLVIGLGKGENFVASDVTALLPYTRSVIYLEDEEFAEITADEVRIYSSNGKHVQRAPVQVRWDISKAQKSGYPHFMLKEIHEQPAVVKSILSTHIKKGRIIFESVSKNFENRLKKIEKIHFVSCGTAYHAGMVGNYMLGECLNLPVEATVSSEFRYEDPSVDKKDLVILITQSGETADTLAALREAKAKGALILAIVNVVGSTIAREADCVIYTHAGPEIGVASTKAYIAQLTVLLLFSLYLAKIHSRRKKSFSNSKLNHLFREIFHLPALVKEVLHRDREITRCAKQLCHYQHFLYLGRGYNFPNALEGALKLKEITYAHAHGYPAGEMKHGPIALIDRRQPVICICPRSSKTYEKMLSNIEEIKARNGIIISIATKGDKAVENLSRQTFFVPDAPEFFSPILTAIPLQLLAYRVAVLKGRDVDQPRNLAKSVTVE